MHIVKSYPPTTPADSVRIFLQTDSIPASAELLGDIAIYDTGFSTGCGYMEVIDIARKKTAITGGNAFALTEHKPPAPLGSSCHRIKGNMLSLPVSRNIDSLSLYAYRNEPSEGTAKGTAKGTSPEIEARSGRNSFDTLANHTIYFKAGYSAITSTVIVPEGSSGNPRSGFDLTVGYRWRSAHGWGFGMFYNRYRSHFTAYGIKDVITIQYIAPEFVYSARYGAWILSGAFGAGYVSFREKADKRIPGMPNSFSRSGMGTNLSFGFEYMATRHFGLGVTTGVFTSRFATIEGEEAFDVSGIKRITLDAGIFFHF